MKIIKRGQVPSERMYRITCYKCKTEFEFKQSEGQIKTYNLPTEPDAVEINCPVCNVMCYRNASDYVRN